MTATVYCSRHKADLPADLFTPSAVAIGRGWCRPCYNESRRGKPKGARARLNDACLNPECGTRLVGRRSHAKYCSRECAMQSWRNSNPEQRRAYWLRANYRMSISEYDTLMDRQRGLCAICERQPDSQWNVDHCHASAAVRGLLCSPCNVGLGQFTDSPANLRAAASYIEQDPRLPVGDPSPTPSQVTMGNSMRCSRCERDLPHGEFSPSRVKVGSGWCRTCCNERRREQRSGRRAGIPPKRVSEVCLSCGASILGRRAHSKYCSQACALRAWRADNPDRHRFYRLKCVYGLGEAAFSSAVALQDGRCAICRVEPDSWDVDHCHETGAVRGLLCANCNRGLGSFGEDSGRMRRAAEYVRRTEAQPGHASS